MRRRRQWLLAGVVLAGLTLLSRAGVALVVSKPLVAPDAIVSLASHDWERLPEAARAAAEHPGSLVLLTLPPVVTRHNCHDCDNRPARLETLGVSPSRVRVLPMAHSSTYGEAEGCLAFAREFGLRRILVVTSPYHTRRALAAFNAIFAGSGVDIGVRPALETSRATPGRWWGQRYDRGYVVYEWLAVSYYAVRYRVLPIVQAR